MAKTIDEVIPIEELTTEQSDATDPDYREWKRRKIEAALKHAREHPTDHLTHDQVFDRLKAKFRS
ncbi:MAG: hypothetical protein GVY13_07330 [Alphaproteobacteria bacterium]|jgi:hypothetical protein|nr:hypothetical protein [Alphaproteobacteria bacterium]